MPRYFFDINDGNGIARDDEGVELFDVEVARREAILILPQIAQDRVYVGDHHLLTSNVRNEIGDVVLRVTMSIVAEWVG